MIYTTHLESPLGPLTLASDGVNLVGLWFDGQKYFGGNILEAPSESPDLPVFSTVGRWLSGYFAGERPSVADLPLAPAGGAFYRMVWELLCEIPYGTVTTYGAIAEAVAARLGRGHMSAQAVGGAVGHNPISIVIPCHRVVGAKGSLTGYAGGIDKKRKLLELEGVDLSGLFV